MKGSQTLSMPESKIDVISIHGITKSHDVLVRDRREFLYLAEFTVHWWEWQLGNQNNWLRVCALKAAWQSASQDPVLHPSLRRPRASEPEWLRRVLRPLEPGRHSGEFVAVVPETSPVLKCPRHPSLCLLVPLNSWKNWQVGSFRLEAWWKAVCFS